MLMWASWIIQPGQSLTSRPEQNFACRAVANCVEPKRGGLVGLGVGGNWIVSGAVYIASILGVCQSLISLTIVAVGASLPELATAAGACHIGCCGLQEKR